ncbi:MAG: hypothetical protein WCN98_17275 [Verrucomicrobiaceae bacterium]
MHYNFHIMKHPICSKGFTKLAICLAAIGAIEARAATSIVQFAKNDPDFPLQSYLDPFYNDGNSTVFLGQVKAGEITAELSARYYDSDPLRPGTNGLINSDLPWNRADPDVPEPGYLVRFGLQPDGVGNPNHTHDPGGTEEKVVPASYITFRVKSPESVIYDSASLVIQDTRGVTPSRVWAVASDENYLVTRVAAATFTADEGHELRWEWSDLELTSSGLEIRVYGITGADEGYFSVGPLTIITGPPPVPEPSVSVFLGLTSLALVTARRRRSC